MGMNPLRLGIFSSLQQVGDRQAQRANAQRTLEEAIADKKAARQSRSIEDVLHQAQANEAQSKATQGPPPRNIDPLSLEGIVAGAKRAGAVARAEAPYKRDPNAAAVKQPNEANTKAAGMLHRMIPVGQDLNRFDDRKTLDAMAAKAGMFGNWASSPEGRQLKAAGDAWIYSVLRPESGATIGDKERETYNQTYLQQPGDDDGTLEMKRRNRRLAEEGVFIQAGPAAPQGSPRSAMEADSTANPSAFNAKYHKAPAQKRSAAAILAQHGLK